MSEEFSGRVALVTGGSRGIGRATALELARAGADVAVSYHQRENEALAVVEAVQALGRRSLCVRCDVSSAEDVTDLVGRTREALGPVDLLAHCGAISTLADHTELTHEIWREMIEVNLSGAFRMIFAVKDSMLERGFGRIVLISSAAALRARPQQMHYSAAKAGVIALARSCAEAFGPHGVRVNCVAPGLVETEMVHVLSDERIAELRAATPLRRVGKPEEIAEVISFLLSERSAFMTGQTVVASGGRVMLP